MKPLELKLKESLLLSCILIVFIFTVVAYGGENVKNVSISKKGLNSVSAVKYFKELIVLKC